MINAQFAADFSAFQDAVAETIDALGNLQEASEGIAPAIEAESSAAAGAVEDVTKETKKLTSAQTDLVDVVKKVGAVFGVAFTAKFFVDAVRDLAAFGSELEDLSSATQLSTTFLQEFGYAGEQSGVQIDAIAKSAQTLQKSLAGGGDSVTEALKRLNLEQSALIAMSPEDAFTAVAGALRDVGNQAQFVTDGAALMGKGFNEIAPLIRSNFEDMTEKARRLGLVLDESTIKALGELDDNLNTLTFAGRAMLADFLEPLLPLIVQLTGLMGGFGKAVKGAQDLFQSWLASGASALESFYSLKAGILDNTNAFGLFDSQLATAREGAQYWNDVAQGLSLTQDTLTASTRAATGAKQGGVAPTAALTDEAKKLAAAEQNIADVLAGDSGVSGSVKEAIKYFLQLGASQSDLAVYFGETTEAVRKINEELRAEAEAARVAAEALAKKQVALDNLAMLYRGPDAIPQGVHDLAVEMLQLGGAATDVAAAFDLSATAMKKLTADAKLATEQTKNLTTSITSLMLQNAQARKANQAAEGFDIFGNRIPTTADAQAWDTYGKKIEDLHARQAAARAQGADPDVREIEAQYWRELQEALTAAASGAESVAGGLDKARNALQGVTDKLREANAEGKKTASVFETTEYPRAILTKGGVIRDLFGRPVTPGIGLGNLPLVEATPTGHYTTPVTVNVHGSVLSTQWELKTLVEEAMMKGYAQGGNRLPA